VDWKAVTTLPTLADLVADPGELIASCQNSHHNAVMPVDPVLARYGPTTPFPEVKGRFRCSVQRAAPGRWMSGRTGRGTRPARLPATPTDDG
jgi:hypothetical protein